jgi:hydrogenase/urease accessory protein HupE
VTIAVIYACAHELDELTLRSTLFLEEATPHQIIGTFRHGRALENYLLSRGLSEAVIHVKELAQSGPSEAVRPGQFQIEPPPPGAYEPAARAARAARAQPVGSGFLAFFVQGIFHILGGLDHVLFVVALISVVASWRQLALVVTSFTAAHSITLALGALDLVRISPRVVEPLIAVTILYVALENVLRDQPRSRLGITFGFGLVHGFGFSSVLRDLGLPRAHLLPVLLGFNLGVETGQLLIVAPLAPFVWWLRRRTGAYPRFRVGVNSCVALAAAFWFFQRLFVHQ